jgi:hypothetical protein
MTLPSTTPVSFTPPQGQFEVDSITLGTSPGGSAAGATIDLDPGFLVSGKVSLPAWLPGSGTAKGKVCLYADELGGPINTQVGNCADVDFNGPAVTPDPPGMVTVTWSIAVTPGSGIPDPQPGASQLYHLAAVFTYGAQTTDIAAFIDVGEYVIN